MSTFIIYTSWENKIPNKCTKSLSWIHSKNAIAVCNTETWAAGILFPLNCTALATTAVKQIICTFVDDLMESNNQYT